jgi:hypothetical protein
LSFTGVIDIWANTLDIATVAHHVSVQTFVVKDLDSAAIAIRRAILERFKVAKALAS